MLMVLCSLFSVFDPVCEFLIFEGQFKWIMMSLVMIFINWQFFLSPSGFYLSLKFISKGIIDMVKLSFSNNYKSVVMIIISIFLMLLVVGESGMVPYVFTSSSHLCFNLSLSLPLWLGGFIYMFGLNWKSAVSHFVPLGCPSLLIPFLVVVETLSNFIRPFSLSVRLMSNIMAGHMIMTLLGGIISYLFSSPLFIVLIFIQTVLVMFEMGVALVQAYVFMNLVLLYWKENMEMINS